MYTARRKRRSRVLPRFDPSSATPTRCSVGFRRCAPESPARAWLDAAKATLDYVLRSEKTGVARVEGVEAIEKNSACSVPDAGRSVPDVERTEKAAVASVPD